MAVALRASPFDPYDELRRHQHAAAHPGSYGATASFVGTMRDVNEHEPVRAMTLEHYPGMTERHLERIEAEARRRWDIQDVVILHRVGRLEPNDPIVLVAVWSAHRAAAFDACRYLIEELKTRAPFWKKERRPAAERWVEHNTPADGALP